MKKVVLILIFLLKFVSGMEIDFSCPDEVYFEEDFECEMDLAKNKISYDVKITIKNEEENINKIWEGSVWQRSDWYAKELVNSKETFIRLKIDKEIYGSAKGIIKLRKSSDKEIVYEEEFNLEIIKKDTPFKENLEKKSVETSQEEINLNSKDIKTKNYTGLLNTRTLNYAGLVFLGVFSGILYLITEKRKNDRRKYQEDTFHFNS